MVFCSGSNKQFIRLFLESTVINFDVNEEFKVFPGKSKLAEEVISYSKMNTLLFCVFTFRVDYEMYLCRYGNYPLWKVPSFGRRRTICSSFKVNTTS